MLAVSASILMFYSLLVVNSLDRKRNIFNRFLYLFSPFHMRTKTKFIKHNSLHTSKLFAQESCLGSCDFERFASCKLINSK